jgi:hypothetical protein
LPSAASRSFSFRAFGSFGGAAFSAPRYQRLDWMLLTPPF